MPLIVMWTGWMGSRPALDVECARRSAAGGGGGTCCVETVWRWFECDAGDGPAEIVVAALTGVSKCEDMLPVDAVCDDNGVPSFDAALF